MKKSKKVYEFPEIMSGWDYSKNTIDPKDITVGSRKEIYWKCKNGHSFKECSRNVFRKNFDNMCPICANKSDLEKSSLVKKRPDLLKEWDYSFNKEDPSKLLFKSRKIIGWICKNGHKWQDALYVRSRGGGCPYCANKRVSSDNNLMFRFPEIAKEWNYKKNKLTPESVVYSSEKKYWWVCKNGHEWIARLSSRTGIQCGCPYCSKKVQLKDGNCFDSLPEVYLYLRLKYRNFKIEINKRYGLKGYRCDFYLPEINTYVEVTSFYKNASGYVKKFWPFYYEKILKKKQYVENVLHEKFRFIQLSMNSSQKSFVKEYVK